MAHSNGSTSIGYYSLAVEFVDGQLGLGLFQRASLPRNERIATSFALLRTRMFNVFELY